MSGTFGEKAQRAKDARGWSVRDLAKQAGVTATSADLVVTGRDVRLSVALRVAEALGLDAGDLGSARDLK